VTLELQATPQEVMRAVEALQEFGQVRHVPERALFGLTLALEESASNIVNHALRRDARQKFLVTIEETRNAVTLELRDRGPAFDPTQATANHRTVPEEQAAGGWGIQLVRRYIDEIRYTREDDENVLRLTKRLNEGSRPQ
jgi:serine/threonine-protein kinase RsbW